VLAGGLVGNILLTAKGERIGRKSLDFIERSGYAEYIDSSKALLAENSDKILLPVDLAGEDGGRRIEVKIGAVPEDFCALDIGAETARAYRREILESRTVFVNGPMGVFERPETELGTREVWQALADTTAFTVVGGGDSITATDKYGVTDKIGFVCTGGGALIRFLTGSELPVVKALRHAAKAFG
jgi:phosphoglycerate kinase